jgi:hypothetical protein
MRKEKKEQPAEIEPEAGMFVVGIGDLFRNNIQL